MMGLPTSFVVGAGALLLAASSQAPTAVVEDVTGRTAGVQFMDYVDPDQVIKLGPQDSITIGYLKSCVRETITGGTVIVGQDQSDVRGGNVVRSRVDCDGGKMLLTAQLAAQSGAAVVRDLKNGPQLPQPQFTIYGLSPIIEAKEGDTVVLDRLDMPGERHNIFIGGRRLLHGGFIDLARANIMLAAGGLYRAKDGDRELVFRVDRGADSGATPIVGRLLRFPPTS